MTTPKFSVVFHDERPIEQTDVIVLSGVLSSVVYEANPIQELLSSQNQPYTNGIKEAVVSETDLCSQKFMIARTEDTLYVSFMGTNSIEDCVDDATAVGTMFGKGLCHKGFEKRAKQIPLEQFACELQQYPNQKLVFCGHSLGGAVAQLVTMRFLNFPGIQQYVDRIHCITFGAPFFADERNMEFVVENRWAKCFLTIVNKNDCIPFLLYVVDGWSSLKLSGTTKERAAHVNELLKMLDSKIRGSVLAVPYKLASDIMSAYFKAAIPQYCPIGNYCFIETSGVVTSMDTMFISLKLKKSFQRLLDSQGNSPQPRLVINSSLDDHHIAHYCAAVQSGNVPAITSTRKTPSDIKILASKITSASWSASNDKKLVVSIEGSNLGYIVESGPFIVTVCTTKVLLYEQPQAVRLRHHDKVEITIPFGSFDEQDKFPDVFLVSLRTVFGLTNFVQCKPADASKNDNKNQPMEYNSGLIVDKAILHKQPAFLGDTFYLMKYNIEGGLFEFDYPNVNEMTNIKPDPKTDHWKEYRIAPLPQSRFSFKLDQIVHIGLHQNPESRQPSQFCVVLQHGGKTQVHAFGVFSAKDESKEQMSAVILKIVQNIESSFKIPEDQRIVVQKKVTRIVCARSNGKQITKSNENNAQQVTADS